MRTQAVMEDLCTSSPQQCGYSNSIVIPPDPARRSGHRNKRFSLACSSEEGDSPLCQVGVPGQTHRRALVAPMRANNLGPLCLMTAYRNQPLFRVPLCRTRDMKTHRELTLIRI